LKLPIFDFIIKAELKFSYLKTSAIKPPVFTVFKEVGISIAVLES